MVSLTPSVLSLYSVCCVVGVYVSKQYLYLQNHACQISMYLFLVCIFSYLFGCKL